MALLIIMGGMGTLVGQEAVTRPTPSPDAAESSTEQGRTQLDESFRDWRLEKRRAAFKDTTFEVNFRTFFLDRNKFDGVESQAWAIGGWAGLKTGYFLDHFAFGVTGYLSEPLYGQDDRDGTLLLKPGQEGYAVLGEAYGEIRIIEGLTIDVGRKAYDTPFINRNDSRMTPNTFEAIVLQGRIVLDQSDEVPAKEVVDAKDSPAPTPKKDPASIKYGVGYFDQIKERNSDDFVSMSVDAGATVERGVWAAGALYENGKKFSIGAIDYFSEDIINIAYAETKAEIPLSGDWKLKLGAQFVDQRNTGDNLLQGGDFTANQFGFKIDLPVQKALFTAGFTTAWGDANLRAPWSGYPGYTSVQVQDFNRDGESAFLFRVGYDFPVDGLSAYVLAVLGTTPDAAGQFRQDEYDANLQWAPKKNCLKGLSIRLRYGVVGQHGGDVDNLTDFRTICNYVINF